MSKIRSVAVATAAATLIAGCASTDIATFFPPDGSQVVVNEELNASGGTRLFIQNGQIRQRRDVTVGNPHCQFILVRPRGETSAFDIPAGTFTISRTYREVQRGSTNVTMHTFMDLASDSETEVSQLACSRWGSRKLDGFLTIEEMQETLSPLVEMRLAAE